jgi:AcrR family transcriptional regulator
MTSSRAPAGPAAPLPRQSLRERKQAFVRDAIWSAAVDLFASKGFEETTLDDIVESAGTSRRTFFRYFASKRDLIAQPVVGYAESIAAAIDACPGGCPPSELLRHVVLDVARRTVSDPRMLKVMQIAARHPAAREAQLSRLAEVQERVTSAFARRCRDEVTAHLLAGLSLAALSVTYRVWFSSGKTDIAAAVRQTLARLSAVVNDVVARP